MNKTKIICRIVTILIVAFMFSWFWTYKDQMLNVSILNKSFILSVSMYSSLIFLTGFITAIVLSIGTLKSNDIKAKEYEKKLSTTSINTSKDKSKIEALERKIATLEKALETKIEDK